MKNCVYGGSAQTEMDLLCMPGYAMLEDNYFATAPIPVVQPISPQLNEYEEKLHSSFESAISRRVELVNYQLSLLATGDHVSTARPRHTTSALLQAVSRPVYFWRKQRRVISLICLGLSLLLLGFDLMGLLVLWR
jgi:hypothetical protein